MLQCTWGEVQKLLHEMSSFPSDVYPEAGLLDHVIVPFLIIQGTTVLFSLMAEPVYFPTKRDSQSLTTPIL